MGVKGIAALASAALGIERPSLAAAEAPVEQAVSRYICAMPFLWLDIDDECGPNSLRGVIERNAIALLSNHERSALDPDAQHALGFLLRSSGGSDGSRREGANFWKKAAEQEAAEWWKKAAERGHPRAQLRLGSLSYDAKRFQEAAQWWRRAAQQGDADAQFLLGLAYSQSIGVPQNLGEAHKWLNLAVSAYPPGTNRDKAIESRTLIEQDMTKDEISAARNAARDWVPKYELKPGRRTVYSVE